MNLQMLKQEAKLKSRFGDSLAFKSAKKSMQAPGRILLQNYARA